MKNFNKKAEKKIWFAILFSIPFLIFVLWQVNESIGIRDIIIISITVLVEISCFYFVKRKINK